MADNQQDRQMPIMLATYIHCESKKLGHFYFYCN